MNTIILDKEMEVLRALKLPYCELTVRRNHALLYSAKCGEEGDGKRFFLYSVTKVMTVSAAMRLWQEGRLDLDAPVSSYLPAYADAFILRDGKPCAPETVMTVRHLFTMSAGLDYQLDTPFIREAAAKPGATTRRIADAFIQKPLSFSPGERFQYSLCHDVLGAVIEAVSGLSLADYMRKNIFEPLKMERTSFDFSVSELSPKYVFDGGEYKPDAPANGYRISPTHYSGGAGVVSDTHDLSLFADALACQGSAWNGYRLLKPESIDLMRTDQMPIVLKNNNFSCAAGPEFSYGLGVHTLVNPIGKTPAPRGVFGWDGAAGAYVMSDPQNALSIAFIMHIHNWTQIRPVFHKPIRDAVYAALQES